MGRGRLRRFARSVIPRDRPGPARHGQSDRPHDAAVYREPDVAFDALAVLDAEGIEEPVHLWGYSRGTRLAYMLAIEAPQRVRRIVAGGSAVSVPDELVRTFTQPLVAPLRDGNWTAYWQTLGAPMDEHARRRIEAGTEPEAFAAIWQGMADQPYPFDLSRVAAPCLLYVGGEDVFAAIVPEDARRMGAELHIFEGLNHSQAYQRRDLIEPLALAHFAASD